MSVATDQQMAGLIMKLGGGVFLWTIIVLIFFRWSSRQDHGTKARRAVLDEDGNPIGLEDRVPDEQDELTFDDVNRVFEQSGPARRETLP